MARRRRSGSSTFDSSPTRASSARPPASRWSSAPACRATAPRSSLLLPRKSVARSSKAVRSAARGAALVVAALLAACTDTATQASQADPRDTAKVARGAKVYAENCAACHGAKLEGQPDWRRPFPNGRMPAPPHDESGHTWHHTDEVLFGITKYGVTPKYAPPG